VQRAIELLDGSALRLTVARLYSPGGVAIQGNGVVPDLTVADEVETTEAAAPLREEDLPGALGLGSEEEDEAPVFDAAARIPDLPVRLAYQVLRLAERRRTPEPVPVP
jgi:carboxyl-terminal processing protease